MAPALPAGENPPYAAGEIVMINGFTHLGVQQVVACTWGTPPGSDIACWMCECSAAPAEGQTAPGEATWRGPAAYLSRMTL